MWLSQQWLNAEIAKVTKARDGTYKMMKVVGGLLVLPPANRGTVDFILFRAGSMSLVNVNFYKKEKMVVIQSQNLILEYVIGEKLVLIVRFGKESSVFIIDIALDLRRNNGYFKAEQVDIDANIIECRWNDHQLLILTTEQLIIYDDRPVCRMPLPHNHTFKQCLAMPNSNIGLPQQPFTINFYDGMILTSIFPIFYEGKKLNLQHLQKINMMGGKQTVNLINNNDIIVKNGKAFLTNIKNQGIRLYHNEKNAKWIEPLPFNLPFYISFSDISCTLFLLTHNSIKDVITVDTQPCNHEVNHRPHIKLSNNTLTIITCCQVINLNLDKLRYFDTKFNRKLDTQTEATLLAESNGKIINDWLTINNIGLLLYTQEGQPLFKTNKTKMVYSRPVSPLAFQQYSPRNYSIKNMLSMLEQQEKSILQQMTKIVEIDKELNQMFPGCLQLRQTIERIRQKEQKTKEQMARLQFKQIACRPQQLSELREETAIMSVENQEMQNHLKFFNLSGFQRDAANYQLDRLLIKLIQMKKILK